MKKLKLTLVLAILFSGILIYFQFAPPSQSVQLTGGSVKETSLGVQCNLLTPNGYKPNRGWPVNYHYNQYGRPIGIDCVTLYSEDSTMGLMFDIPLIAFMIALDVYLVNKLFHKKKHSQ